MAMKINKLEIENVKRVKAVKAEFTPNGLTVIGGNNNQGKTSILDAIAWALGGNKYKPSQAQRQGSVTPPHLHVVMNNGLIVGRGTRLAPGKKELLLLDFLWHTERHELCHPANLIATDEKVAKKMTENIEELGAPIDLEVAEQQAKENVALEREESLAKQLAEMKKRKRKLVDPLQFEMSIQATELTDYVPSFGWQMSPPTDKQVKALEKWGIFPDEIENAGKAEMLINRLVKRRDAGLSTPKQIRFLENRGFQHVGTWQFEAATKLINRIAANGWRIPHGIKPAEYKPA